jgi:hypothetical protein
MSSGSTFEACHWAPGARPRASRMVNGVWIRLNEQLLASLVRGTLLGAGAVNPGKKGEPLTQEAAQLKALQQQATELEQQGLRWLQSLGVVGG